MYPHEYAIHLHLGHPQMDLTELSQKLSKTPSFKIKRMWKANDPRQTPKGQKLDGHYTESYCSFDFFEGWKKSDQESLPDVFEKILEQLVPFKDTLHDFIQSGGSLEFIVALFINANSAVIFYPDLLKKLADFNIALWFDIYPPDSKKQQED